MTLGEFDLIARYFSRDADARHPAVRLGVGDDCALLSVSPGHVLATSTDLLVEGRHFFPDVNPRHLGHKALAVNLSDLAASGARPLAFLLGLSLPRVDPPWLSDFSDGLFALADEHRCALIGGDTTACTGPLTVSITVMGEVPAHLALRRSGARVGDQIYVSGQLGDARLALEHRLGHITLPNAALTVAQQRLELPTPRVALGQALHGLASACIDLSDGLVGDLTHIVNASHTGAELSEQALLASCGLSQWLPRAFPRDELLRFIASGGDDYELLFTAHPSHADAIAALSLHLKLPLRRVGHITEERGIRILDTQGHPHPRVFSSFDHFSPRP